MLRGAVTKFLNGRVIKENVMRMLVATCTMAAAMVLPSLVAADDTGNSVRATLWQPSMNVFRRYGAHAEKMFEFYGPVLGFEQLVTFNPADAVGGEARFQAGAQELKLTGRVPDRTYVAGGVRDATGVRLLSFFFASEGELVRRFEAHGLPRPVFRTVGDRRSALVTDPDGQSVELVIEPDAPAARYREIEVGVTVSDLEASRAFYRDFAGLEELPPVHDPLFDTIKYSFRHGATTVSLRSFAGELPADTGSGGIQYVVSDADAVDAAAKARGVVVEKPLTEFSNGALRTIWLEDPDGTTNYFAETATSRRARTH
jgi:catechol 2,3-dioxygenase-like lactoylglutathione lyase family enzyme